MPSLFTRNGVLDYFALDLFASVRLQCGALGSASVVTSGCRLESWNALCGQDERVQYSPFTNLAVGGEAQKTLWKEWCYVRHGGRIDNLFEDFFLGRSNYVAFLSNHCKGIQHIYCTNI